MLRLVGEVFLLGVFAGVFLQFPPNLAGSFLRLVAYLHRWERDSTPTKSDKTEKPKTNTSEKT